MRTLLTIAVISLLTTACGNKGPLTLPSDLNATATDHSSAVQSTKPQ